MNENNTAATTFQPSQAQIDEAAKWAQRFEVSKNYHQPMFAKWAKWYEDMYAYVRLNKGAAPWRSKVYMPIIASKIWDLIARFIQYRPGWEVGIRTLPVNVLSKEEFDAYMADMNSKLEKVKMSLDYDYENPLREEPIQDELLGAMLDAAVTGYGIGRVPYVNKTVEYITHPNDGDEFVDYSKEVVQTAQEGYNDFQSVNVFNFFPAPGSKGLQRSPWFVIHSFVPKYELEEDGKYKNLQYVKGGATNEFAQYESSRNRLVNTQDTVVLDSSIDMVEIFECWDKKSKETITFAKSSNVQGAPWIEIHRTPNPYWHKKYPFVMFYVRRKPYTIYGESIFENSETLQSAVNDVFNHHMDGLNMADGMIAIEEGAVVEPYRIQPGGEIRYRGDMPKQFKFPSPDVTQLQTIQNLINGAIENATISQYASGIPNSDQDQTAGTATGVTRMMEAAAEKIGFMRSNFRRSWRQVGEMWMSNSQQFLNHDLVVEKVLFGNKTHEVVRPADLQGLWNIRIDDSSFEPVSKDAKRQDYLQWAENLSAWQANSVAQAERTGDATQAINVDWNEVALRGSEHFSENYSRFTLPATEPLPVAPEGAPLPAEDVWTLDEAPVEQAPISADEALADLQGGM